jgi:hypothetical protein
LIEDRSVFSPKASLPKPCGAPGSAMHVRFYEAWNDHRILEAPIDLKFLVGDPTADFVQCACWRPYRFAASPTL